MIRLVLVQVVLPALIVAGSGAVVGVVIALIEHKMERDLAVIFERRYQ